jgi:4-hydroxy-tetrahydrodipicolinate synthase
VKDLGVTALQVTVPHYVFPPDDDTALRHFEGVAKGTGLPIIIYNVVRQAILSARLLTRIITTVDGVIGVKASGGDMKMVADLILLLRGRGRVMSAVDALMYPSFALGAHGAISSICTAVPVQLVQLWETVQAGDFKKALALHEQILPIWNSIGFENHHNLPANTKTCQELLGRKAGVPRAPMPASYPAQKEAIRAALHGPDCCKASRVHHGLRNEGDPTAGNTGTGGSRAGQKDGRTLAAARCRLTSGFAA